MGSWTMFKAPHPMRGVLADEGLKTALRQTLFALACRGDLGDEDELRTRLLASVAGPREALRRSVRPRRPRKI
jgi:hypothetical protein